MAEGTSTAGGDKSDVRRRVIDDSGLFSGDDFDENLLAEIETRLEQELADQEGTKRRKGEKVELDKADLDFGPEPDDDEDDFEPLVTEPEPEAEPEKKVEPPPPPKEVPWAALLKSKRVMVAGGVMTLVLVLAVYFALQPAPRPKPPPAAKPEKPVVVSEVRGAIMDRLKLGVTMKPFFIPLRGRTSRILKLQLTLVLSDAQAAKQIRIQSLAFRDAIYQLVRDKSWNQLTSPRDKVVLQVEIMSLINRLLPAGQVKRVFFNEFIFS